MQLYLLRHGIAEDAVPGQPDSERALTSEGCRRLRGVLKLARAVNVAPTLILTSPFKRALETAALASSALDCKEELVHTPVLTPSGKPELVWDELRLYKDQAQLLLVGHDPLFTYLTGYLLRCPGLLVDFKKGAIVRIDMESLTAAPRGVLKWMLVPKLAK